MANRIATILGVVFLLVGLLGFLMPGLLGAHLTGAHNIIHLVSGAIALWLGLKGTPSAAKTFCLVFGLVYLLLGVAGFLLGTGDDKMLTVLPDQLDVRQRWTTSSTWPSGLVFLIGGVHDQSRPHGR